MSETTWLERKVNWIAINNDLPPNGRCVLATDSSGRVHEAYRNAHFGYNVPLAYTDEELDAEYERLMREGFFEQPTSATQAFAFGLGIGGGI